MSSPVTLTEIGRRMGVSHVTVSNVLNRVGQERFASKDLAKRIRACAAETGYIPNHIARSLKSGKTNTIVLVTNQGLHFPYVYEVIEGIQKELAPHGYHLNLEFTLLASERKAIYRFLFPGRCDGVILLGLPSQPDDEQSAAELRRRVPVVVCCSSSAPGLDCVDYDRVESTRLGIAHLLDQGRRRVAIILGPGENPVASTRLEGCRKAFAERGLSFDQARLFNWDVEEDTLPLWRQMRALPELPDAVFSFNEEVAMSLMRHIRRARLNVPRDIAVATQGNTRGLRFADIPLTAVDSNHREIARCSVDRLLAQIKNRNAAPGHILVQPRLFVRRSSMSLLRAKSKSRRPAFSAPNPGTQTQTARK